MPFLAQVAQYKSSCLTNLCDPDYSDIFFEFGLVWALKTKAFGSQISVKINVLHQIVIFHKNWCFASMRTILQVLRAKKSCKNLPKIQSRTQHARKEKQKYGKQNFGIAILCPKERSGDQKLL